MRRFLLFRSRRNVELAALIVLALMTVTSCGSQDGSQGDQSGGKDKAGADGSTGSAQSATTAKTTEGREQKGGGQKDGGQKGGKQKDGGKKDGGSLTLVNVQTNTGWKATKREVSSDDIEIDFRQGKTKAEFGAELDDSGRLSLEINQKLKGPIPS
jgi:hypothetical protein